MPLQTFQNLVAGMTVDQKLAIGSQWINYFATRAAALSPPLVIDPLLGTAGSTTNDPRWAALVAETCAVIVIGNYQGNQDGITWGAIGAIFGPPAGAAPPVPATPAAPGAVPAPAVTAPPSAAPLVQAATSLLGSMFAGS